MPEQKITPTTDIMPEVFDSPTAEMLFRHSRSYAVVTHDAHGGVPKVREQSFVELVKRLSPMAEADLDKVQMLTGYRYNASEAYWEPDDSLPCVSYLYCYEHRCVIFKL